MLFAIFLIYILRAASFFSLFYFIYSFFFTKSVTLFEDFFHLFIFPNILGSLIFIFDNQL